MTTLQEKIVNITTGEETFRPYTAEEIAQVDLIKAQYEADKTEADKVASDKASLLAKLGISADDLKSLLS